MCSVEIHPGTRAALYARVSSDQQAQAQTITSQVEARQERRRQDGLELDPECLFTDAGYRGATLVRPALERLRDMAALGVIDRLYVHSPDRRARRYAYQVLRLEELQRGGVEVVFLNHALSDNPEEQLRLQVQGMMAEYERAKIIERHRRGKVHAARPGSVNVLAAAPYGYRYLSARVTGGHASYEIVLEQARVVRQIFAWVGEERVSLREVCRRLKDQGIPTATGKSWGDPTTIWGLRQNPAYPGKAGICSRVCWSVGPAGTPTVENRSTARRPKASDAPTPTTGASAVTPTAWGDNASARTSRCVPSGGKKPCGKRSVPCSRSPSGSPASTNAGGSRRITTTVWTPCRPCSRRSSVVGVA